MQPEVESRSDCVAVKQNAHNDTAYARKRVLRVKRWALGESHKKHRRSAHRAQGGLRRTARASTSTGLGCHRRRAVGPPPHLAKTGLSCMMRLIIPPTAPSAKKPVMPSARRGCSARALVTTAVSSDRRSCQPR